MKKDTKTLIMSILSYVGLLFLIPLFVEKENKWIRAHVKNGFVITVAFGLLGLIVSLTGTVLSVIPILGDILAAILGVVAVVLEIAGLAAMVYGIYLVATDKEAQEFPVVSVVADNYLKFLD